MFDERISETLDFLSFEDNFIILQTNLKLVLALMMRMNKT